MLNLRNCEGYSHELKSFSRREFYQWFKYRMEKKKPISISAWLLAAKNPYVIRYIEDNFKIKKVLT